MHTTGSSVSPIILLLFCDYIFLLITFTTKATILFIFEYFWYEYYRLDIKLREEEKKSGD